MERMKSDRADVVEVELCGGARVVRGARIVVLISRYEHENVPSVGTVVGMNETHALVRVDLERRTRLVPYGRIVAV